jgi:hypothetical protein
MKKWLKIRRGTYLFMDGKKPALARKVQQTIREKLNKIGFGDKDFEGGISLRKGGALTMALCGVPDRVIRAYGRWKSYAYRIYLDLTQEEKQAWAAVVSSKVEECDNSAGFFKKGALAHLMDDV